MSSHNPPPGSTITPLVIIGGGGFAHEVRWLVDSINEASDVPRYEVLGHLDDNDSLDLGSHGGQYLGKLDWLATADRRTRLVLGVGFPRYKKRVVEMAKSLSYQFETLIHPRAEIGGRVRIGEGCIITAGNILTVDIVLEDYVLINLACTIGHGTHIGRYATLSPHCTISGNTQIEEGVELGSRASTKPGVRVGAWSVVGLNSGVVRDVPAGVVAVGCPARAQRVLES